MYDGGTCEIDVAQLCEPSGAVPDPACLNGIDDGADDGGIYAVDAELCALRHGAGDYRRCGRTEDELEHEVRPVEVCEICEQLVVRHTDEPE
ncbi:hypothetical protein SDC9_192066 [bioreactor metagenome]|uniref:Uncharacterized protein n=1 Tax=bioreactor metagenome TaxID=1076179 RepID=A0A645HZM6_9ZZZZ